jgi:hypothetical protein
VEDEEIKYDAGGSRGFLDPENFASNRGLRPGDTLILTSRSDQGFGHGLKWDTWRRPDPEKSSSAGPHAEQGRRGLTATRLRAAKDVTGSPGRASDGDGRGLEWRPVEHDLDGCPFLPEREFASMCHDPG